jgi:hypothetical protein
MVKIKKKLFLGMMGRTIWEEYKNRKKRITLVERIIERILLTFFGGENVKIGPCIETFKVMEMNVILQVIEMT